MRFIEQSLSVFFISNQFPVEKLFVILSDIPPYTYGHNGACKLHFAVLQNKQNTFYLIHYFQKIIPKSFSKTTNV